MDDRLTLCQRQQRELASREKSRYLRAANVLLIAGASAADTLVTTSELVGGASIGGASADSAPFSSAPVSATIRP
ncbi:MULTISPECIES: hypothetical protein [unclassified Frankia]|uniref:hypothetical protein n=1 Tax=unclassified Frankia TaxID=2632575 RepID=UPI002024A905